MTINQVALVGHLTREPDIRTTQKGLCIMKFCIAVNERVKCSDSEWEDRPNYIDLTMFGRRAEGVSKYLSKGSKVSVAGSLRYSSWESDDGTKRSKLEVIVSDLEMLTKGEQTINSEACALEVYDDDVPF